MLEVKGNMRPVAVLGNHLPRMCGIATFTHDIAKSLRDAGLTVDVIAMTDGADYDYPAGVAFEIEQDDASAYPLAAQRLNEAGYDLVNVQHEYGIYGGDAGSYLLALMRDLKMPIVTTLHTVLQKPNNDQREVLDEIIGLSQRLVVMSEKARELLRTIHGVPASKIALIPHGIPNLPPDDPEALKEAFGLGGRKIVLTFGLVSESKGMEYVIEAMAKSCCDPTYVIVGRTHPHVKRDHGEVYRDRLVAKAKECGVEDRVVFIDRFVSNDELGKFIKLTDVYVSPYLNMEQITSGTLAYTVGNGKAVISTPYWHAEELLSDGRGLLVPARDSDAIANAITKLLGDDSARHEIEENAKKLGEKMRWPAVAESYVECFNQASLENNELLREIVHIPAATKAAMRLPDIRIDHLDILTDDTGIVQHATYSIPNRDEGYCVDDNARALLVTVDLEEAGFRDVRLARLQSRYLSFCAHSLNHENGRFRNFMSFDRRWLEDQGSEDSHGRCLWCLGSTSRRALSEGVRSLASELFSNGREAPMSFTSPRAWAYSILGYVQVGASDYAAAMVERLLALFEANSTDEWPWLEPAATYANARLPQALMLGGRMLGNNKAVDVGLAALNWLSDVQRVNGLFCPIGNHGFFRSSGEVAKFDQQPIEATAHVSACMTAFRITGDRQWKREAERAFAWFVGANCLATMVAEPSTGGCRDGLQSNGANRNQGAESTVSYLGSLAELTAAMLPAARSSLL
jgi:glycosyltransferase involved in cell wall biosynthesis